MKGGKKMKQVKVFFQGAFDLLNHGHIKAITRAANAGDYLIIGLNTNELYRKYKGREPLLPYWQKKIMLEGIKGVDKVIPARTFSPLKILKKYDIDVYVIALEWKCSKDEEIRYMKSKGGRVIFTKRYKGVTASSDIKKKLLEMR